MRELTQKLSLCLLLLTALGWDVAFAQVTSRSKVAWATTKTAGITATVPCAGTVLLSEDFENGIPAGWLVIDGDGRTPASQMQLQPGWQGRTDYRDSTNSVAVSPSWYSPPGQSDDWLITSAISLGNNPCLSWRAYSQDPFYKETYEIRIANTPDTAAFLANAAIVTITDESGDPITQSASLAGYAGQTVYLAFRQTSTDKFVLALDDIQVTNVQAIDIGVYSLQYGNPDPGDTVTIRFEVANYGSDTITSLQALYTIDGGPAKFMAVGPVSIPPNGTLFFNHDSLYFSDTLDENYDLCAWTSLPNATFDQAQSNDTLCGTLTIGEPVGRPDEMANAVSLLLFPNPCTDEVILVANGMHQRNKAKVTILDLEGRSCLETSIRLVPSVAAHLPVEALQPGMYFLRLEIPGQSAIVQKLMKR